MLVRLASSSTKCPSSEPFCQATSSKARSQGGFLIGTVLVLGSAFPRLACLYPVLGSLCFPALTVVLGRYQPALLFGPAVFLCLAFFCFLEVRHPLSKCLVVQCWGTRPCPLLSPLPLAHLGRAACGWVPPATRGTKSTPIL